MLRHNTSSCIHLEANLTPRQTPQILSPLVLNQDVSRCNLSIIYFQYIQTDPHVPVWLHNSSSPLQKHLWHDLGPFTKTLLNALALMYRMHHDWVRLYLLFLLQTLSGCPPRSIWTQHQRCVSKNVNRSRWSWDDNTCRHENSTTAFDRCVFWRSWPHIQ